MSAGPRILVLGTVLSQPAGGVWRHNQELLRRLAERLDSTGGELSVLVGREPPRVALEAPIRVLPSSIPTRPIPLRATREGLELRRILAAARSAGKPYHLVHTGHLPAPRHLGVPLTVTIHDLRSLELEHTPLSRRLLARSIVGDAVRRAAAVLTVSEHVRAALLERFRLAPERVRVIGNGCDHLEPLPRVPVTPEEPGYLLHVGHLEPRKNLELLVRALAADRELPPALLAGAAKRGEDERLRALAAELGVSDRLHLAGPFEDAQLAQLYARAACVVLPSRLEGFGIPAIEAQLAGVPLAVARAAALPEVAGLDSGHAESFDPDDPIECASAVRRALGRSQTALDAARQQARDWTWDRAAERWWNAWRDATRMPPA